MDSKTMNVMIIIVLTLVFILVPMIMKKVVWKKLLVQLNNDCLLYTSDAADEL